MKWSKLKQRVEDRFADGVRGRARIHITRYGPGVSGFMTRAWVTWDGREVVSFSTPDFYHAAFAETGAWPDGLATRRLHARGLYSRFDFTDALDDYLTLSIADAVRSENDLVRAIAMLD